MRLRLWQHGEPVMAVDGSAAARIAALEAEVQHLQQRLHAADEAVDPDAPDAAIAHPRFVPASASNCFGVKPCLHSTAAERVNAGCLESVWGGYFGNGTRYERWVAGNITFDKPVAPQGVLQVRDRFHPTLGEQCDLADVWALSRRERPRHVTDAMEAHVHQRLAGAKNALWLFMGSSVDHGVMKATCEAFDAERITLDPSVEDPMRLAIDYCRLPSLNLTLVNSGSNGMVTTALQHNSSLQETRFQAIDALLQRANWGAGPTFISFGGMEWDFKNWRCEYPRVRSEWRRAVLLLQMQARAARAVWPAVRGMFVRSMFAPTVRG